MNKIRLIFRSLCFLTLLIIAQSCEKEFSSLGLEVTPPQDQLFVESDTVTVFAYSVLEDSLKTSYTALNLLGSQQDPVFGRSDASIYTQIHLSSVDVDFGDNPRADSLILYLKYNGYYGDTNTPLTLRIYEIAEDLYPDSVYYSTTRAAVHPAELGHLSFYPHPTDSVVIDGNKVSATLRIPINIAGSALAEKLLNASEEVLADNDEFVKYFKGLYLKVDPVPYHGAILYFSLTANLTGLRLYYQNEEEDSLSYTYVVSDGCQRFNHFDHEGYLFADPQLRKQVIYKDTLLGKQINYLHGMSGIKMRIWFPTLKDWGKTHRVGINEAQLILPNLDESDEWTPPAKLALLQTADDNTLSTLDDESDGSTYFGGSYNTETREYRFRLNHYVQDLINQKDMGDGLTMIVSGSAVRANRLILSGPQSAVRPMKLRIVYSYSQ